MTTTLSIHSNETDPDMAFASLEKAVALIKELRAIPGLRVVVSGDLQATVVPTTPETEKARLIKDIRRMLPIVGMGHPELVAQIEDAMKQVEAES